MRSDAPARRRRSEGMTALRLCAVAGAGLPPREPSGTPTQITRNDPSIVRSLRAGRGRLVRRQEGHMRLSIRSKIILALPPLGLACLYPWRVDRLPCGRPGAVGVGRARTDRAARDEAGAGESFIKDQLRYTTAAATSRTIGEASRDFIAALKEMRAAAADPVATDADNAALTDLVPREVRRRSWKK